MEEPKIYQRRTCSSKQCTTISAHDQGLIGRKGCQTETPKSLCTSRLEKPTKITFCSSKGNKWFLGWLPAMLGFTGQQRRKNETKVWREDDCNQTEPDLQALIWSDVEDSVQRCAACEEGRMRQIWPATAIVSRGDDNQQNTVELRSARAPSQISKEHQICVEADRTKLRMLVFFFFLTSCWEMSLPLPIISFGRGRAEDSCLLRAHSRGP